MKFKNSIWALVILMAFGLGSCKLDDNDIGAEKAAENDKFLQAYFTNNKIKVENLGDGVYYEKLNVPTTDIQKAATGDVLAMHYILYTLDGRKVDSTSRINKKPYYFPKDYTENSIFQVAAKQMVAGELSNFYAPFYYGYGDKDINGVPAYSPIKVAISLDKIMTENKQVEEYMANYPKSLTKLKAYDSGLRVGYLSESSRGAAVVNGSTVTVKYTGNLLFYTTLKDVDGKPNFTFDSGTIAVKVGAKQVVPGFEEGISKLKVGDKAVITFPSSQGYGETGSKRGDGSYAILPKTPISFEIEILSVAN
jgi:FKBP-type peptidyl-prolyl cis-trans isomerase